MQVTILQPTTLNDDQHHSYCTVKNVARSTFQYSQTVGALGTLVVSVITLGLLVNDQNTLGSVIATVAVAAIMVPYNFGKDTYEFWDICTRDKKIKIKEKARDKLETERFKELTDICSKTLIAIDKYSENQDKKNFKECIETVAQLPQNTEHGLMARDICLSRVISISKNEDNLKETASAIQKLAEKIDSNKQDPLLNQQTNKQGNTGESANHFSNDSTLDIDLKTYQFEWKKMEEKVGFPLNVLLIGGQLYDKNANPVGERRATLIVVTQASGEFDDQKNII